MLSSLVWMSFSCLLFVLISDYDLKNPCTNSIYLQPTSTHKVVVLINLLNFNKANGHDDIDPYFLKIASLITVSPRYGGP